MSLENAIWAEKYRPRTIDEIILPKSIKDIAHGLVKSSNIPSLLFTGPAGTGKTTLARAIANEINADFMMINASSEGNVDLIRTKLLQFASTVSFTDSKKITLLDECLDESTLVTVLRNGSIQQIKIKDLNQNDDLVKSYNFKNEKIEWLPFSLFDKGLREDCLEVSFENGEVVICTPEHKWFVLDENNEIIVVQTVDLYKYNYIITDRKVEYDNTTSETD